MSLDMFVIYVWLLALFWNLGLNTKGRSLRTRHVGLACSLLNAVKNGSILKKKQHVIVINRVLIKPTQNSNYPTHKKFPEKK